MVRKSVSQSAETGWELGDSLKLILLTGKMIISMNKFFAALRLAQNDNFNIGRNMTICVGL